MLTTLYHHDLTLVNINMEVFLFQFLCKYSFDLFFASRDIVVPWGKKYKKSKTKIADIDTTCILAILGVHFFFLVFLFFLFPYIKKTQKGQMPFSASLPEEYNMYVV